MTENKSEQPLKLPLASLVKRRNATILIVEDDKFFRDMLSRKLQEEGYSTIEAVTGDEGLNLVKEKKPALVLLDITLPGGIDGFELLKRMEENKASSHIPVLVLSNFGGDEERDRAQNLGAKDFYIKAHTTPNEIVEKIKETIQKSYL